MKKILLIIAIVFCIFQMVVLATFIDIGNEAKDRDSTAPATYTVVDKLNSANANGKITQVEIYANTPLSNCEVGIFSAVGNVLTTRDSHTIGSVTAGSKKVFPVDLDVVAGDYIGIYWSAGDMERTAGSGGYWYLLGDNIPCTSETFSVTGSGAEISLYGTGDTADINIGNPAITRTEVTPIDERYTIISKQNVANASGKITSVEIYAYTTMSLVEVATFFVVSGNNLSTRDFQAIGNVVEGAKRTFAVDIDVQAGDYIGITYYDGSAYKSPTGEGYWHIAADQIPCTNETFTFTDSRTMSLYGTGIAFPAQVTGVSATDGTFTDKVVVTWNAADGATGYDVWTGSSWVDVGNVTTYDHTTAPAPTITHGSITASDGTSTAHVALSNTGASTNVGSSISYKVRAYNAAGDGPESATNAGYRGVGALTYQWYRSNVDGDSGYGSISGATASTYNDTAAPAPTITVGTASASDGTSSEHVTLSIAGESANIGAGRYYKCYHTAIGATPGYTGVNRGYRGVGALTFQWQRSSGDADADYSNIDGATTDPYNDTGAPEDGSGRYYKCIENATGAAQVTTNADRGYRIPAGILWNGVTITKWNGITITIPLNTQ